MHQACQHAVIAMSVSDEAIQDCRNLWLLAGLLRRFAPRNDGGVPQLISLRLWAVSVHLGKIHISPRAIWALRKYLRKVKRRALRNPKA